MKVNAGSTRKSARTPAAKLAGVLLLSSLVCGPFVFAQEGVTPEKIDIDGLLDLDQAKQSATIDALAELKDNRTELILAVLSKSEFSRVRVNALHLLSMNFNVDTRRFRETGVLPGQETGSAIPRKIKNPDSGGGCNLTDKGICVVGPVSSHPNTAPQSTDSAAVKPAVPAAPPLPDASAVKADPIVKDPVTAIRSFFSSKHGDTEQGIRFGMSPEQINDLLGTPHFAWAVLPTAGEYRGSDVRYLWSYFKDLSVRPVWGQDAVSTSSYVCFLFEEEKLFRVSLRFFQTENIPKHSAVLDYFANLNEEKVKQSGEERTFRVVGNRCIIFGLEKSDTVSVEIGPPDSPVAENQDPRSVGLPEDHLERPHTTAGEVQSYHGTVSTKVWGPTPCSSVYCVDLTPDAKTSEWIPLNANGFDSEILERAAKIRLAVKLSGIRTGDEIDVQRITAVNSTNDYQDRAVVQGIAGRVGQPTLERANFFEKMGLGDGRLAQGQFDAALEAYQDAQKLSSAPEDQTRIEKSIESVRSAQRHQAALAEGLQALSSAEWATAKECYSRALKEQPEDDYAKRGVQAALDHTAPHTVTWTVFTGSGYGRVGPFTIKQIIPLEIIAQPKRAPNGQTVTMATSMQE